MKMRRAKF